MADVEDMFEGAPTDAAAADIEAPDSAWPKTLAEYMDVLRATFQRLGASDAQALDYAEQGVLALGHYCGGRNRYLPTGDRLQIAARDRRIYMEYNGRNKHELAARYHTTTRRIEQIAAEQRVIYIRRIQPELFPH